MYCLTKLKPKLFLIIREDKSPKEIKYNPKIAPLDPITSISKTDTNNKEYNKKIDNLFFELIKK